MIHIKINLDIHVFANCQAQYKHKIPIVWTLLHYFGIFLTLPYYTLKSDTVSYPRTQKNCISYFELEVTSFAIVGLNVFK